MGGGRTIIMVRGTDGLKRKKERENKKERKKKRNERLLLLVGRTDGKENVKKKSNYRNIINRLMMKGKGNKLEL